MIALLWRSLVIVAIMGPAIWGALALGFRAPFGALARGVLIGAWLGVALAAVIVVGVPAFSGLLTPALAGFTALFGALCVWWRTIRPRQHRDWAPDVARLLDYVIDGTRVRLFNVRNFEWRSREDFDVRWETRDYDLSTLCSIDLVASYWRGPSIAHTLASFGFADGRYLVFSVEVRRLRGQRFSALGGFFKRSEVALVAADERDIVRTRSNARGEDVYLYRVAMPRAELEALFRAYLREADALRAHARFYNTLFSNCTTLVFDMVKRIVPGLPRDRRLLLSGHLPEYFYDLNAIDTSRAFADVRARGYINPRALASDRDGRSSPAFSRAIRRGIPRPDGRLIDDD